MLFGKIAIYHLYILSGDLSWSQMLYCLYISPNMLSEWWKCNFRAPNFKTFCHAPIPL